MIKKVIEALHDNIITEHENVTFNEVYDLYKDQDVTLTLIRYDNNGFGWVYTANAIIGNCKYNLTTEDYYTAYDQII